jgi:hypothetical protein
VGIAWIVQPVPFQLSAISSCAPEQFGSSSERQASPTAMQAVADVHETALKVLIVAPGIFGVGWTVQPLPSRRAANVTSMFALFVKLPTAVHAISDVHDTRFSAPLAGPLGSGIAWVDQRTRSRRSARWSGIPAPSAYDPTPMHTVIAGHDTAANRPVVAPWGFAIRSPTQFRPFQRSASGWSAPLMSWKDPTVLHAVADMHETSAKLEMSLWTYRDDHRRQ